jgi:hypothetical protein
MLENDSASTLDTYGKVRFPKKTTASLLTRHGWSTSTYFSTYPRYCSSNSAFSASICVSSGLATTFVWACYVQMALVALWAIISEFFWIFLCSPTWLSWSLTPPWGNLPVNCSNILLKHTAERDHRLCDPAHTNVHGLDAASF